MVDINYLQDLDGIRGNLTDSFTLKRNLDFNDDNSYDQTDPTWATKKTNWTSGDGWLPIGDAAAKFTGSFDGDGFIISNLLINRSTTDYVGLFGYDEAGSSISNLGVTCNITGRDGVGGLIGWSRGDVDNCYSTGQVNPRNYGGGLIGGSSQGATITNSYSECGLTSSGFNNGGFIGRTLSTSTIENCYATGNIITYQYGGGFIGYAELSVIRKCYSTGNVEVTNRYAGGFVSACDDAEIIDCYTLSSVANAPNDDSTGGFSSFTVKNNSKIENCYSIGVVPANGGGFNGTIINGNINNCFWDIDTSGRTISAGGTGKTTEEMKIINTFVVGTWDIANNKVILLNDGYPYLSWQISDVATIWTIHLKRGGILIGKKV